ncbi:MAG: hypothetical protein M1829_006545, partial [Trizodia sp. TS-e1964]
MNTYQIDEVAIQKALTKAREQENPNVKSLARGFNVDYQKLRRRVLGGVSKMELTPGNQLLSDAQEAA